MHLSKLNYYSDFIVYPLCIATLAILSLLHHGGHEIETWTLIFLSAIVTWTLVEYLLHRFVFHHFPYIRDMHEEHHHAERDLLGTPIWLSLPAHLLIVFVPALLVFNLQLASAFSAGIMVGYLWYVAVHHIVHHWHTSHHGYLYKQKRRHALHHHVSENFNYGVTTGIWDFVFHTVAPEKHPKSKVSAPLMDKSS